MVEVDEDKIEEGKQGKGKEMEGERNLKYLNVLGREGEGEVGEAITKGVVVSGRNGMMGEGSTSNSNDFDAGARREST